MRSITSRELGWCKDKCTALCLTTSMSPCVFPCPLTACWRNMNVPCTRALSPGLAAPLRERKKETKERDHLMREPILFSYVFHSIFFWSHWQKSQGKPLKRIEEDCTSHGCFIILYGCLSISGFNVSFQDKLNSSPETPFHAIFTVTFCGESLWKSVLSV